MVLICELIPYCGKSVFQDIEKHFCRCGVYEVESGYTRYQVDFAVPPDTEVPKSRFDWFVLAVKHALSVSRDSCEMYDIMKTVAEYKMSISVDGETFPWQEVRQLFLNTGFTTHHQIEGEIEKKPPKLTPGEKWAEGLAEKLGKSCVRVVEKRPINCSLLHGDLAVHRQTSKTWIKVRDIWQCADDVLKLTEWHKDETIKRALDAYCEVSGAKYPPLPVEKPPEQNLNDNCFRHSFTQAKGKVWYRYMKQVRVDTNLSLVEVHDTDMIRRLDAARSIMIEKDLPPTTTFSAAGYTWEVLTKERKVLHRMERTTKPSSGRDRYLEWKELKKDYDKDPLGISDYVARRLNKDGFPKKRYKKGDRCYNRHDGLAYECVGYDSKNVPSFLPVENEKGSYVKGAKMALEPMIKHAKEKFAITKDNPINQGDIVVDEAYGKSLTVMHTTGKHSFVFENTPIIPPDERLDAITKALLRSKGLPSSSFNNFKRLESQIIEQAVSNGVPRKLFDMPNCKIGDIRFANNPGEFIEIQQLAWSEPNKNMDSFPEWRRITDKYTVNIAVDLIYNFDPKSDAGDKIRLYPGNETWVKIAPRHWRRHHRLYKPDVLQRILNSRKLPSIVKDVVVASPSRITNYRGAPGQVCWCEVDKKYYIWINTHWDKAEQFANHDNMPLFHPDITSSILQLWALNKIHITNEANVLFLSGLND